METDFSHTLAVNVDPYEATPRIVHAGPVAPVAAGAEEVIAGYVLQEQLGLGGYGEVWRAIGPGGLAKAVKILFGRADGPQAETEMRSLQKIKDVRHPFILSVERIEVAGNRLVIVTELADESLENRFAKAQAEKKRGIPREELLAYLHDAAEALDYMHDAHGLQHLDVKPGNLLLQAGRVKVADFGLVKDLQQCSMSLISGFTPLFAAPEVFEGRPSPHSDQYSLAVMYQLLLTGVAPFSGRNPAQLVAQHTSGKPDLAALPPSDRPAVARALSKAPALRFPNCRAFIETLEQRHAAAGRASSSVPGVPCAGRQPRGAETRSDTRPLESRQARALPPHDLTGSCVHAPTLFLGIGGLAGKVLRQLRSRLSASFGDAQGLSAFSLLYLDSDPEAVQAACTGPAGQALGARDALEIGLRDAGAYRAQSPRLLEWLSRRWLYNIPRSQRVEGMRPLGRLAFVDHCRQIRERLSAVLPEALRSEAVPLAAAGTNLTLDAKAPEVFVVASISGGTGSGAVLDAGYLVRSVFEAIGAPKPTVTGILLHITSRRDDAARVQRANAVACLRELAHLSQDYAGYPGDKACGLEPSQEPPFDYTYLVPMAEGCSDADFDLCAVRLAEYLYRVAATPVRHFLQKQRLAAAPSPGSDESRALLGTFAVGTSACTGAPSAALCPESLCRVVVARWLSRQPGSAESPSREPQTGARAAQLLERLELTPERLTAKAMAMVSGRSGRQAEEFFRAHFRKLAAPASGAPDAEQIRRSLAEPLEAPAPPTAGADHPAVMLAGCRAELAEAGRIACAELQRQILAVVDSSECRIDAAMRMIGELMAGLSDTANRVDDLVREIDRDGQKLTVQLEAALGNPNAGSADSLADRYVRNAMVYFCRAMLQVVSEHVAELRQRIKETSGVLLTLRVRLEEVAACVRRREDRRAARESGGVGLLLDPGEEAAQAFDAMLRRQDVVRLRALVEDDLACDAFERKLYEAATEFVLTGRGPDDGKPAAPDKGSVCPEDCENQAIPLLDRVGGGRRVMAAIPPSLSKESWQQRLVRRFGDCLSIQSDPDQRLFVLCEVLGISLDAATAALAANDDRILEIASRLHTRTDISWKRGP